MTPTAITLLCIGLGAVLAVAPVYLRYRFASFMAQRPADYTDLPGEPLDLRRHLNGPVTLEGIVYGPFGTVTARFVGEAMVTWTGASGVMTERFTYDDGRVEDREWRFELGNDGSLRATASDVLGQGKGQLSGPSLLLRYRLRLPPQAGGHVLDTTDWMYLAPNGTIVNRSQFRKWGLKVAELVATLRPKDLV